MDKARSVPLKKSKPKIGTKKKKDAKPKRRKELNKTEPKVEKKEVARLKTEPKIKIANNIEMKHGKEEIKVLRELHKVLRILSPQREARGRSRSKAANKREKENNLADKDLRKLYKFLRKFGHPRRRESKARERGHSKLTRSVAKKERLNAGQKEVTEVQRLMKALSKRPARTAALRMSPQKDGGVKEKDVKPAAQSSAARQEKYEALLAATIGNEAWLKSLTTNKKEPVTSVTKTLPTKATDKQGVGDGTKTAKSGTHAANFTVKSPE